MQVWVFIYRFNSGEDNAIEWCGFIFHPIIPQKYDWNVIFSFIRLMKTNGYFENLTFWNNVGSTSKQYNPVVYRKGNYQVWFNGNILG